MVVDNEKIRKVGKWSKKKVHEISIEMPVITVWTRLHLSSGLICEKYIHLNHWGRK